MILPAHGRSQDLPPLVFPLRRVVPRYSPPCHAVSMMWSFGLNDHSYFLLYLGGSNALSLSSSLTTSLPLSPQDRAKSRYVSPLPYNIDTPNDATYSKASKEAGLGHSPASRGTPKGLTKAMPPPKTRRALKPRASGLQRPRLARSQGAVLGPRNGRRLKAEGPIKANVSGGRRGQMVFGDG